MAQTLPPAPGAGAVRRRRNWLIGGLAAGTLVIGAAGGTWYALNLSKDPVRRADRLEAAGNIRGAAVELRNGLRANVRDPTLHLRLAEAQMKLADPVAAEKEFRLARSLGADRWTTTLRLADALLAQGQFEETLRQVPRTGPTPDITAKSLFMRSVAQLSLNDIKAATATLAAAQHAAPDALEVPLIAARLAAAREDYVQTEARVDEVLARDPTQIDALLMKQQIVTARNDHVAALELAERAVKSAPWSAMSRIRHATELLYARRDAEARKDVDAVLDLQPRFIEAIYLNGILLARAGKYIEAAAALGTLDAVLGRFPQALYYKALVAANLDQVETAVALARRYNVLVPDDPDGIRLVARSDLAARAPDHAIPILERAAAAGIADAELLDLLGAAYGNIGNTPAAIAAFTAAAKLAPNDPGILTHLGLAQIQAGSVAEAAGTLIRTTEIAPAQAAPLEALVSAAIGEGDLPKAEAALARLRVQAGETQAVGILTGMIQLRKRDLDGARVAFSDTVRRFPGSMAAKLDYARVLVLQGRRLDGMALMAEVLAKDPANVSALNSYVPLLSQNRQIDKVVTVLGAAHTADPRQAGFTASLADALVQAGDAKRAVEVLGAARVAGPLPPMLQASLARAQTAAGLGEDAKANFRDVLSVLPDDVVDRTALIDLLLSRREWDAARIELQAGLARAPRSFRFMSTLVELESQTRGIDAALKLAEQLRADPVHGPFATLLKGDALMRARRYNAAARTFLDEYAIEAAVPPLLRAAAAYVAGGQDEEGAKLLREWLRTAPNTPAVLETLAKIDLRAGRLDVAQSRLEALLALIPNEPAALNNLAWTYQQRGDKRARATAQRAYLQAPGPDAADTLGWILQQEGDADAAMPLLQQAIDVRSPEQAAQFHLAVALRTQGRTTEAIPLLEAALARPEAFAERPAAQTLLRDLKK